MTLLNDNKRNALIRQPSTNPTTTPGGERIVSRMVGEAIEVAKRQAPPAVRRTFTVGDFELCEPDYRQVLRWARQLDRSEEDVINVLAGTFSRTRLRPDTLRIDEGAIKELVIVRQSDYLPIEDFDWEEGLSIESLTIHAGMPHWSASRKLPSLKRLKLLGLKLTEFDLSRAPGLTEFDCSENQLTELDLSPVPGLTTLDCSFNSLETLDLSPVPKLTDLWCQWNKLNRLDLFPVPELTLLSCEKNQLTYLDLSPVPSLTDLWCDANQVTEIDLRPLNDPNIEPGCDPGVLLIR